MTVTFPLFILASLAATNTLTSAQNTSPPNVPLNFNCSTFAKQLDGQDAPYMIWTRHSNSSSAPSIRISKAVTCPSDLPHRDPKCQLKASRTMNISATTNITSIPDARILRTMLRQGLQDHAASSSAIADAVFSYTYEDYANASSVDYVPPGQAGYLAFRPQMKCYEGRVQAVNATCGSGDPGVQRVKTEFEAQGIQICVPVRGGPSRKGGRYKKLLGDVELKIIGAAEAGGEGMDRSPFEIGTSVRNGTSVPMPSGTVLGAGARAGGSLGAVVGVVLVVGLMVV